MDLTGNVTEADLVSAAVAMYCGMNVYEAIREDRKEDMRKGKKRKR